ncbi:hypothetical protein [Candidatus Magnetobacterium casense]|uniref:Uncharacterized protein n=1 Tax=Candidatus Magnetobacterium casense TaxID=1455061 RepID=A0ABS6RWS6_9BACT|nr:hypothetical protein [Candidatus Magnetobacterium casensis]MBV6341089.1 hypothetical protein [Candidatus Magnetobacterium casensis]
MAKERMPGLTSPNEVWLRAVSWACADFCSRVEIPELQATEEIAGSANDSSYNMLSLSSGTFDRIIGKPFWGKYPLDFLEKGDFDSYYYDTDSKGTPQFYNIFESELRIAPIPNSAETLKVPYQMTSDDASNIPERYKNVLVKLTCMAMLPMGSPSWLAVNAEVESDISRYQGQVGYKPKSFKRPPYKQARQEIISNIDR